MARVKGIPTARTLGALAEMKPGTESITNYNMSSFISFDQQITKIIYSLIPHNQFFDNFFSFFSLAGANIWIWLIIIVVLIIFEEKKDRYFFRISILPIINKLSATYR